MELQSEVCNVEKITNRRTFNFHQLSKELNTSEVYLVEKNAAIEPHLLYINPYTTEMCLDSHFVNVFLPAAVIKF